MPTMTELLSKPQNLPSVPEVVRELIQSFNEPEPDLLLIAGKVAKDPVLSAKLLRLANSAKFGCSRQIATVKEAAVRLGTDSVRNMVLACSLTGSLKTVPGIDLKHFWAHVFDVAALAKQLSKTQGNKGEEVFTCALLYDLGRLIMHLGLPENLVLRICDLEPHKGRAAAEQAVVGFTYADVGAELAKQWNFPDSFCRAICYHYHPLKAEPFSNEAALIHLAIALGILQENIPEEEPEDWPHAVAERLGLSWLQCRNEARLLQEQGHGYAALIAA